MGKSVGDRSVWKPRRRSSSASARAAWPLREPGSHRRHPVRSEAAGWGPRGRGSDTHTCGPAACPLSSPAFTFVSKLTSFPLHFKKGCSYSFLAIHWQVQKRIDDWSVCEGQKFSKNTRLIKNKILDSSLWQPACLGACFLPLDPAPSIVHRDWETPLPFRLVIKTEKEIKAKTTRWKLLSKFIAHCGKKKD